MSDIYNELDLRGAFRTGNLNALMQVDKCGCCYCLRIFSPTEIVDYVPDRKGNTAICPYCQVDCVIGESEDHPLTTELLQAIKHVRF